MAFTVFADGAKACIDFDWNGIGVSICLHFEKATPSVADYIALANSVAGNYATEMLPNFSEDLVMGAVTVYDLSEEGAPKYVDVTESGEIGGLVADAVPNNTACVISHRTTTTGRSGRGRNYLPGVVDSDVANGLLSTFRRNEILSDWGVFISDVESTGWSFVVAQRFDDGVQLTTGVMREVVSEILKLQLGSQRRRQVISAT